MDIAGFARVAGRKVGTVRMWRTKPSMGLPPPAGYVSGSPWWWSGDILRWLEDRPYQSVAEDP